MNSIRSQTLQKILHYCGLLALVWTAFGPVQLGGPVSYVIISGNSMEPDFQVGDLVLARKRALYQVDEVVVYNHPQIGHVFHRIVDGNREGFVLKGDHNEWLDSYQPGADDILGRYWLKIPGAGQIIRFLRQPAVFVAFILIAAIIVFSISLAPGKDQPQFIRGKRYLMKQNSINPAGSDLRQEALLALGLLFLAGLILGWIAWNRPLTISAADDIKYRQHSAFSYSAEDEAGVYNRGGIQTGDPIYPSLVCQVDLQYYYRLDSQDFLPGEEDALQGVFRLRASVRDADGWNRSFLLVPEYHFMGSAVQARSSLNVCRILQLIEDKEQKTGTEIRWYTLAVEPEIEISGTIRALSLSDRYTPRIEFALDETVMRLPDDIDPLALDQDRVLADTREIPNTILVLGRLFRVSTARWIAGSLLAAALLAAIYPAWTLARDWRRSAISRIEIENQTLIVQVKEGSLERSGKNMVEMNSFQDLRKWAERYGSLIMHEIRGGIHTYSVMEGDTLYQFSLEAGDAEQDQQKGTMERADQ